MGWRFCDVVIRPEVRSLCARRYPGHPHGCPNHGKRATCPPQAPLFADICDPGYPTALIWNRFEFGAHVERMRRKHPEWSKRQLACCLYWQGGARKALEERIRTFATRYPTWTVTRCPEAMGVDVTASMARIGIALEWPPESCTYQVAVAFMAKGAERPERSE